MRAYLRDADGDKESMAQFEFNEFNGVRTPTHAPRNQHWGRIADYAV
jgi:hypothetical protein